MAPPTRHPLHPSLRERILLKIYSIVCIYIANAGYLNFSPLAE